MKQSKKELQNGKSDIELVKNYAEWLEQKELGAGLAFKTHLTAFVGVNGFLFFLWMFLSHGHPWFLYPLGAWGIGLAHHFTHLSNVRFKSKILGKFRSLSAKGLGLLKRYCASRGSFRQHATAAISVSAYLLLINTITGVHFQWWLIPAAALGMGLSIHGFPHFSKLRYLKRQLNKEAGGALPESAGDNSFLSEAKTLETYIRKELSAQTNNIGTQAMEILPVLEGYVKGIAELTQKKDEIDQVLASHPIDSIIDDRKAIEQKQASASSAALIAEYSKTIDTLARHEQSFRKLEERKELIDLRLQSSIQSLRHLQLEIARLKTSQLSTELEKTALEDLRIKSKELSEYIEDFDTGFSGLE